MTTLPSGTPDNIFPLFGAGSPVRISDIFSPERHFGLFAAAVSRTGISRVSLRLRGDYVEGKLDLNQHLIRHPAATFFVRVTGDSMIGAGIHSGDILIVDRALEPVDGKVVVVALDGELTVKRLSTRNGKVVLLPENERYSPIEITAERQFEVWGVVTNVIHAL